MKISDLSSFIFDLDGVVWRGATPIEGAVESIVSLRAAGKRCFYCTNNASALPQAFGERLRAMGIEARDEDVMTSSTATALYLQSQFTGQFSAFVVGEDGLVAALRKVGARVVTMQDGEIDEANFPVDCVVAGIDRNFNYAKLRLAQRCILEGARFVATNRDATFPVEGGVSPGAGSIIAAIETASGTTPLTIGKPQPLMANLLIHQFQLNFETTAMIGDRLDTDIVFARRARIAALFVATGVSTREEATMARRDFKPDAIFDDLPALCQAVLGASSTLPSTPHMSTQAALDDATIAPEATATTATEAVSTTETTSDSTADAFTLAPIEENASPQELEAAPQELDSLMSNAIQTSPDETGKSAFDSDFSFSLPQPKEAAALDTIAPNATDLNATVSSAPDSSAPVGATTPTFVAAADFSLSPAPQTPQAATPELQEARPATTSSTTSSDAAMFSLDDDEPAEIAVIAPVASAPIVHSDVPQVMAEDVTPVVAIASPAAPPAEEKAADNWWESMDDIFTDPSAANKKTPSA